MSKIQNYHTDWKPHDNRDRKLELAQMELIKKIKNILHNEKSVVFNANLRFNGHISIMFYTNYIAYDFVPNEQQIELIKMKSYKIAILDTDTLPDFIRTDDEILKFKL